MKRVVKLTATALILIMAGSFSLNAQRGTRGVTDSTRTHMMRMNPDSIRRPGMRGMMNPHGMQGMQPGRGFDRNERGGQFANGRQPGMTGRGIQRGQTDRQGREFGPSARGGRGIERLVAGSLPNVTEKQKKDLADLKLKQQDEMKKFRDEMQTKMQAMREAHKNSMMSLLTEEQKKFIELREAGIEKSQSKSTPAPAKTK